MTVTFVGHRDTPQDVYPLLYKALQTLIENDGASVFYVGDQGAFDRMALRALRELKRMNPRINYQIVLAYMPCQKSENMLPCDTVLPAEVAIAPARFAIDRRNRWLIEKSDTVITYVRHSYGGAATFRRKAVAKGKRIIEL